MSRKARIRAAAAASVALVIGLLFATGTIPGAWANFEAETNNTNNAFAGGWIVAPTSMVAKPLGWGATFTWAHGATHSGAALTSQQLYGVNRTTTSNCTGATYSTIGSSLGGAINATTDAESSGVNGDYFCYQLRSLYNGWYADTVFAPNPIQVGLILTGVTSDNGGGHSGSIEKNDHITLVFNQTINNLSPASISVIVCTTQKMIRIGSNSCTTGTPTVGEVTFATAPGTAVTYGTSTTSLGTSGAGFTNNELVILLAGSNTRSTITGNGTFVPSGTAVQSTTGAATVCTTASPPCRPTTAFGF